MSEYTPRPRVYLSRPVLGPPNCACLSFCELIYLLTIIDAATLHLLVECDAVEAHIGADWLCEGLVVLVRLRDDTFAIFKTMAHSMGHGAVLGKMPNYGAVLAPTASLPRDLGLLLHCEGLQP